MITLRRALAGLVATGVVATGLAVAGASPARATVGTVDSGSTISRTEIVERALSWTTEPVPYSQTSYYPAAAPRTGTGHSYRQDCSGFVSMAWDLPTSAITTDFVSSSSPYDTRLPSFAALQRGDLLGTSGHVVIFLGWSADDAGRHRYFDMASEAHTGTNASVATDQDLDGYWSTYLPYTYKHVVADTTRVIPYGVNRLEEASLGADGHVTLGWQTVGGTGWNTADITAQQHLPILRTPPALASPAAGTLVLIGTGQSGALLAFTDDATGWHTRTLTTSGSVYGIDASGSAGRIDVVGRQVGNTTADGTGSLVHATLIGTTWSGWLRPGTPPPSIVGDPAVASSPGVVDVALESAAGTLEYGTWDTAGATWTWSTPFGSARVPTQPQLAVDPTGTVTVDATINGLAQQDVLAPDGSWSGWSVVRAALWVQHAIDHAAPSSPTRTAVVPRHR